MAAVPLGIRVAQNCGPQGCNRDLRYRIFILVLTFFTYCSYHLSRKPISVVKSVLYQNCTGDGNATIHKPYNCSSWPPFDHANHKELEGSLDYTYLFAYAVAMFFSGHIAERMDLRYFLTIGMIGSGVFTALFGLGRYLQIHSLVYYIAIQIVGGIFQSSGWPAVVACVANWFGKGKRGIIMGIWNSHTSVGNILGSLIAGFFVDDDWGMSFIVPGIIIASMGIIVFFFLIPNPEVVDCSLPNHSTADKGRHIQRVEAPQDYSTDGDDNDAHLQEDSPLVEAISDKDGPSEHKPISFISAIRIPGVIEFSLCLFFAKLVSYTFLFWLPNYISNTTPYSAEQSADLSTLFDVGGIIGGIAAGAVSDFTGARATTCGVMLVFAAPMMFIYETFGNKDGLGQNIGLLMLCGALVNGPYALITTAVSADLGTHKSLKGSSKALATVTAIIDGTGSIGAALGPLFTGLLSTSGWKDVFYMLIAADICALLLLSRLILRETRSIVQRCRAGRGQRNAES